MIWVVGYAGLVVGFFLGWIAGGLFADSRAREEAAYQAWRRQRGLFFRPDTASSISELVDRDGR